MQMSNAQKPLPLRWRTQQERAKTRSKLSVKFFANADGVVSAFTSQEQELLKTLAADTLANGEPQVQRGVSMRIRTTPYDQVFAVVFG